MCVMARSARTAQQRIIANDARNLLLECSASSTSYHHVHFVCGISSVSKHGQLSDLQMQVAA